MNTELLGALEILEKEKNISKDTLLDAIEQSLIQACKNHYGKADNVKVSIDPQTCDFSVYAERTVVEQVEDPVMEISLENALKISARAEVGDVIKVPINSKEFGRIATQNAKKCDSSEDPRGGTKGTLQPVLRQREGCGYGYCSEKSGQECEYQSGKSGCSSQRERAG